MESPFTGGKVTLEKEVREQEFRKDIFVVNRLYYKCMDTGEEFTTDELDQVNLNQVYNQYRVKYGLPFPEEIQEIREQYGLSASKMSEILGLGINSYRQYESGDIPTVANGRLIFAAKDPEEFVKFLEASKFVLGEKDYIKYKKAAEAIIEEKKRNSWNYLFREHIFNYIKPSEYNGYRRPSELKVANMISFFSNSIPTDVFKTKLNKLLFYSDFLNYRHTGYSISGIAYRAIQMGPVPAKYDKLYSKLVDDELVDLEYVPFYSGYGEVLKGKKFSEELFSNKELESMNLVLSKFGKKSTDALVKISHLETAWLDNKADRDIISYDQYAFNLNQI